MYPGAAEVCDGQDNDCDGETWAEGGESDEDGDGYLGCAECDDTDETVYPGAAEVWLDCVDSDCDGVDFTPGDGRDGVLAVDLDTTLTPFVTLLTSAAAVGDVAIVVEDSSGFEVGDLLLLRVAVGDLSMVGVYEFARVARVEGDTLTLAWPLRQNFFGSDVITVQRVPQFSDVTVRTGAMLKAPSWDGTFGGVLAFVVSGHLVVEPDAFISAVGAGYRGGTRSTSPTQVGQQGESQAGVGSRTTDANFTGGGGGSAPSYAHACGGGGGHATSGAEGGHYPGYSTVPGKGGDTVADEGLSTLQFGGAGGAGGLDIDPCCGAYGGAGGFGGGILLIVADTLSLEGTLDASGGDGEDGQIGGSASPGGGGGGAGGTIALIARTTMVSTGQLVAEGGQGGIGSEAGAAITYGGTGGEGRIAVLADGSFASTPSAFSTCP